MSVVAKLFVSSVERQASTPDAVKVTLAAVTRGKENAGWAEATPQAMFSMTIQNPEAAIQFVLGQEFHVTFEAAGVAPCLADGHAYDPSHYELEQLEKYPDRHDLLAHHRCQRCGARRTSHEEPVRGKLMAWHP